MSWENVALGELCEVLDSKRKPITKKDRTTGSYPYYGATGIVDYVGDFIFNEKLVLIGEDGAKWDSGDITAFIADGKYWVNNHAHVIKPLRNRLLDEWLVYYFYYKDLKEFVTGLTVPKLNQGQLKTIPIPLPTIATQQKIVAKLDSIFSEIDKAKAAAEANHFLFVLLIRSKVKNNLLVLFNATPYILVEVITRNGVLHIRWCSFVCGTIFWQSNGYVISSVVSLFHTIPFFIVFIIWFYFVKHSLTS